MRVEFYRLIFSVVLLLACLLNGTPYFIGRIGLLDPIAYEADRQRFCPSSGPPSGLVSSCAPVQALVSPQNPDGFERLDLERLHAPTGYLVLFKAFRLLLLIGFPLIVLFCMTQGRCSWPGWRFLLPVSPLLLSSTAALFVALSQAPITALFYSLRSLSWLLMLVFSRPVSTRPALAQIARAMSFLILLQIPLMFLEAFLGLPMSFGPPSLQLTQASAGLPTRLVGTFILPNSLGVSVACLLGFCTAYLPQRRLLTPLFVVALPILLAARSGTGLLVWSALICFRLIHEYSAHQAIKFLGLVVLFGIALSLPLSLGRPDLLQSLGGRIHAFSESMLASNLFQWNFGKGLLFATPTESLPEWLLLQGGFFAAFSFYGLIFWAWHNDPMSRPFLLSVILCSLTLTIIELFPVNLLLGISINRTLMLVALGQKSS